MHVQHRLPRGAPRVCSVESASTCPCKQNWGSIQPGSQRSAVQPGRRDGPSPGIHTTGAAGGTAVSEGCTP